MFYVNRLFAKAAAELRNIGDGHVVQRSDRVLIERKRPLLESELNAIGQKIILPKEILFLNVLEQIRVFFFQNNHSIFRQRINPELFEYGWLPFAQSPW